MQRYGGRGGKASESREVHRVKWGRGWPAADQEGVATLVEACAGRRSRVLKSKKGEPVRAECSVNSRRQLQDG